MNNCRSIFSYFFTLLLSILLLASCKDEYAELAEDQRKRDEQYIKEYLTYHNIQNAQRQSSGVYYIPGTPGTGVQIQKGSTVKMHYIGRFLNRSKFESTYDTGQPKTFIVGGGQMMKGWEEGLPLLKEGETATLIIPSALAYGRAGNYTTIPGNSVLIYDINILEVK